MTASLPDDVQTVFDRFITTELTTVSRNGQPITWPVTPYYRPGDPCIDVTTGIGLPKKANDARANPLVAMLFSDPTGSGLSEPPMVLVQGTAEVDDRDLEANRARYERESVQKLPAMGGVAPPDPLRRFIGLALRAHLHPRQARACVRVAGRRPRGGTDPVRRAHGGGALRALRGATAVSRHTRRWDQRLGRADRRARLPLSERGAVARLPGRLPVRRPSPDRDRCGRALDPDRG